MTPVLWWIALAACFAVATIVAIKIEREDPCADDEFWLADEAQEYLDHHQGGTP